MLLPDQVECFRQDGYLHLRQILTSRVLQSVRRVIASFVERRAQNLFRADRLSDLHAAAPFETRWALVRHDCGDDTSGPLDSWGGLDLLDPAIHQLCTASELINIAASILGPEICANGDYWVRPKVPGDRRTTLAWHQDSFYYGGSTTCEASILTVFVPLVDVDDRNGCLRIIPGSHRFGPIPWHTNANGQREPVQEIEAYGTPISVPMQVGDVLVFSNLTLHASGENTTKGRVRWSIDFRYTPAGQPFDWHALGEQFREKFPCFLAFSSNAACIESWEQWRNRWALSIASTNPFSAAHR